MMLDDAMLKGIGMKCSRHRFRMLQSLEMLPISASAPSLSAASLDLGDQITL
jgi:hypothetical protein